VAELFTELGANVVGIDFRPNPSARYEHRVFDIIRHTAEERDAALRGNFDMVLAFNLDPYGNGFSRDRVRINNLVKMILVHVWRSNQLVVSADDDIYYATSKLDYDKIYEAGHIRSELEIYYTGSNPRSSYSNP